MTPQNRSRSASGNQSVGGCSMLGRYVSSANRHLTGRALIAAMRASPDYDVELAPARGPSPVRDVIL